LTGFWIFPDFGVITLRHKFSSSSSVSMISVPSKMGNTFLQKGFDPFWSDMNLFLKKNPEWHVVK
jgi:hypothetical protein